MRCRCGGPEFWLGGDERWAIEGQVETAASWPKRVDSWRAIIQEAAEDRQCPPALIAGVMCQESGGNPGAASPAAAYGLMQLLRSTANTQQSEITGRPANLTLDELVEPHLNVRLGAHLLAKLLRQTGGNVVHVLASYNAGGVRCGQARDNPRPSRWGVIENPGYVDGCIRYINAARTRGYDWTISPSSGAGGSLLLKVFFASILGAGVFFGVREMRRRA